MFRVVTDWALICRSFVNPRNGTELEVFVFSKGSVLRIPPPELTPLNYTLTGKPDVEYLDITWQKNSLFKATYWICGEGSTHKFRPGTGIIIFIVEVSNAVPSTLCSNLAIACCPDLVHYRLCCTKNRLIFKTNLQKYYLHCHSWLPSIPLRRNLFIDIILEYVRRLAIQMYYCVWNNQPNTAASTSAWFEVAHPRSVFSYRFIFSKSIIHNI
jgi:hypothetical protein